ncbi:class I SAM-dependent RNA methyltransferase [Salinarimonas ramus]|uniref:RNA methyltransferase n=1 Tax=Salinarimonas ramus TaxID=690164 RepID=A0A917V379_9HYPH|nr:RsmD family RNA methyltransferase [Salinarimonas ramus]GGK29613.1 putative RNA methyltransferase [Salinarimonas ramus]
MTDLLPGETDVIAVDVARLGARGDGIVETKRGPLYVAYALPGERVRVALCDGDRARLVAVETPSPDRIAPFCPYFGTCGGCLTQHLARAPARAWKREIVVDALAAAGVEAGEIAPTVDAHGAGRRRLTFHARYPDGKARVGFMAARSHDLVAIDACPVAEPGLAGAPRAAHALAHLMRGKAKPLDIQVTLTEGGLDVDLRGHGPVDEGLRAKLVGAAGLLDLARLSLHGEILVERRAPRVRMGEAMVAIPPGGFLQATAAGEAALAELVRSAVGKAKRVLDLFAGAGPFALRLAARAQVHAVESEGAALMALDRASRATPGLRHVTTEVRDLFRRPLLSTELAKIDAVVLDPPRAGAQAQAERLAETTVATIAYVSCDPATFARDAAILVGAGYALERVTPVDQFAHAPHVELVGVFRGPRARR